MSIPTVARNYRTRCEKCGQIKKIEDGYDEPTNKYIVDGLFFHDP